MFKLLKTEDKARRGEFTCPHGTVQTPVFMNVGTQAAIKGALSAEDLEHIGTQVELSNTYHLHLRPGDEVVKKMGGLHIAGKLRAELFADAQARHADEEGDHRNDERCRQSHQPAVLRNGEAHRKGIDAGGDALHEQCTGAELCGFFGFLAPDAIHKHLAADVAQQCQRDPRDECFKGREHLHDGVHAHPAGHGHDRLKKGKGARDSAHGPPAHAGVVQAVCHRHRKRIHCKAHAQQGAVEEKYKAPFHIVCLLNLTRISGNTKPGLGRTCTSEAGSIFIIDSMCTGGILRAKNT